MRWYFHYWLLAIGTIPNIVLTLLIGLIFYRPVKMRYRDRCLELIAGRTKEDQTRIWGRPGAQSWGCPVIWYASERHWDDAGLRVHERIHAIHGFWFTGPLFGLLYGLHFLWEFGKRGFSSSKWWDAYRQIWSERVAYRVQAEFEAGEHPDAWGSDE